MTLPAIEPVHYFCNEIGTIACGDADAPYAAELTDDPARVTCAPCRESIADCRAAASRPRTASTPRWMSSSGATPAQFRSKTSSSARRR